MVEIGIDIEEVERFKNMTDSFRTRVFNPYEIEYAECQANPEQTYAGMWCVKEAAQKCMGPTFNLNWKNIFVDHENNVPVLHILGHKKFSNVNFKVSISHTKNYATAVVIRE